VSDSKTSQSLANDVRSWQVGKRGKELEAEKTRSQKILEKPDRANLFSARFVGWLFEYKTRYDFIKH